MLRFRWSTGLLSSRTRFTQSGPRQIHAVYSGGTGVAGSTSVTQTLDVVQSGGGTGGTGSLDLGPWAA
ncbi:hypothetical protein GS881_21535 [Rhodococcus hoagii]|nr:hypothetical protein [Prescottella equi]